MTMQDQPITDRLRSGEPQALRHATGQPGNADGDGGQDDGHGQLEHGIAEIAAAPGRQAAAGDGLTSRRK
jgi:hypothetical protein